MNLPKQIKKYRDQLGLSQEELAEKIYVSRQTISNWENERSYPDVNNLLLLGVLFNASLDELVKGDLEKMKKEIKPNEMDRWTGIMIVTGVLAALSLGPAWLLRGKIWLVLSGTLMVLMVIASLKVEQHKKVNDLKTYKEIIAFYEERKMKPEERIRSRKNYWKSKTIIVILFTAVFLAIGLVSLGIMKLFGA